MSKYTTEVRFICENAAGLTESEGYNSVNNVIRKALPVVFDFDFPIFDENYRSVLETKILKHYYTREIGLETVGLWKLFLDAKLNEIMPYYNQLYNSELLEFNPLYDIDLTRDHNLNRNEEVKQTGTEEANASKNGTVDSTGTVNKTGTTDNTENRNEDTDERGTSSTTQDNHSDSEIHNTTGNTSDETATNTKTHYDKYSDTPQGSLTNVQNDTYLTNARMINDTDTKTGKVTVTGNDDSTGSTNSNTTTDTDNRNNISKTGNTTQNVKETENTTDTEKMTSVDTENRNSTQTANRNLSSIDDYVEHVKGKNGGVSYSAMLKEFRETFLNIDMMIIEELGDLFMKLW